jgi:hypothetical protein
MTTVCRSLYWKWLGACSSLERCRTSTMTKCKMLCTVNMHSTVTILNLECFLSYNRLLFLTRKEAYKSRDVRKLVAVIRV